MRELEGIRAADLDDLYDAGSRATTEEFLLGRRPWPYEVLPVKRAGDHEFEVGYVRKLDWKNEADPAVFTDHGHTAIRRYHTIDDLLDAGWRVD